MHRKKKKSAVKKKLRRMKKHAEDHKNRKDNSIKVLETPFGLPARNRIKAGKKNAI